LLRYARNDVKKGDSRSWFDSASAGTAYQFINLVGNDNSM